VIPSGDLRGAFEISDGALRDTYPLRRPKSLIKDASAEQASSLTAL